jgi:hypothetical protein
MGQDNPFHHASREARCAVDARPQSGYEYAQSQVYGQKEIPTMQARLLVSRSVLAAILFAVVTLSATLARAEDTNTPAGVNLLNAGGVTAEQLAEIESYMARNVMILFRSAEATGPGGQDIGSVMAAMHTARAPSDAVLVVLAALPGSDDLLIVNPEKAWAIVNTAMLTADTPEKTRLRVCLVSMRALASALGVGYGLDEKCVNRRLSSLTDIDKLGGNFSPPTLQGVLFGAAEKGVSIIPTRKRQPVRP